MDLRAIPSKKAAAIVRKLLDYYPKSGKLIWRPRSGFDKETKRWNARYAGKLAGCVTHYTESISYVRIKLLGRLYNAHRIAWLHYYGEWPKNDVDHKHGNGLDNRIKQLRGASSRQNQQNARIRKDNTTGCIGVGVDTRSGKYHARIHNASGKRMHLGTFDNKQEASEAYLDAKRKYHKFQPVPRIA